jgi:glucosamine--fructose-6-phosphate aminotransferase (isomerizing)
VTLSQSGETADTLAGLKEAKRLGFGHSLSICNVPESSLVRESDLVLMTRAGPEIGVASTKAFTTQLVCMMLLVISLGRRFGLTEEQEAKLVADLEKLPGDIDDALKLDKDIKLISEQFADIHNALFLGRGAQYPVAMEGALVDDMMPIIAVAPNNELLEKLKSNLQEVRARGGRLIVFADQNSEMKETDGVQVLNVAPVDDSVSPIIYTIPLQLLSYHVAVLKGTDVDQPRNLAKSVTVE